jgi:hypothetical protein
MYLLYYLIELRICRVVHTSTGLFPSCLLDFDGSHSLPLILILFLPESMTDSTTVVVAMDSVDLSSRNLTHESKLGKRGMRAVFSHIYNVNIV